MRLKKWLNNSVQHTIGMRQTAKPSVTDSRYAEMAKDAAKPMLTLRRRLQRQKAKRKGAAPSLCSGVLKALRMGVWTAHRTTMPQASCILIGVEAAPHMFSIERDVSASSTEQAESMVDKHVAELMAPEIQDFLDFFDGQGQRPFEHAMSAQDVEHIKVTLASMEKRLMGENVMGHEAARMSDQIPIWLKVKPGKIRHVQYEKNFGAGAPAENDDTQAVADGCTRFGGN